MAAPRQYAFYFDSSCCSGCKACQIACKDKHGLEVGRLWRRVYEVCGGDWTRLGNAWTTNVYAYHISLACNHCERPICLEVCPSAAITRRPDGIVLIDSDQCIGCQYCRWVCPYGAPQYDSHAGIMTKCTFCVDLIDQGLPPACVAACPMRALDFGDRAELEARLGHPLTIYPLPDEDLTGPALFVTPHHESLPRSDGPAETSNLEEVNL